MAERPVLDHRGLARTAFVKAHPATVQRFLTGLVDTLSAMKADPSGAQAAANTQLTKLTSKPLAASVLTTAWADITFTDDPLASSVTTQTAHAVSVGLLKSPGSLTGLYDLSPLNTVLAAKGHPGGVVMTTSAETIVLPGDGRRTVKPR